MATNVVVLTDSAASLPPDLAQKWGIGVVPLQVIIDGEAEPEGPDMDSNRVLAALVAGYDVSTSQPSPAAFEKAFQDAADAGATGIVAVLISGKMSGTVNAAQVAAETSAVPVTVVDTRTLAMAAGFAAVGAAALARSGAGIDAVAQRAREVAESSQCIFTVDTLEYLQRGGRVSPAVAAVGKMLSVRPVLGIVDGEVEILARVRTTGKARQALLERASTFAATLARPGVAVMALEDSEYGDRAARELESRHSSVQMVVRTPVSAVLAVHTGPGALAAMVVDLPADVQ